MVPCPSDSGVSAPGRRSLSPATPQSPSTRRIASARDSRAGRFLDLRALINRFHECLTLIALNSETIGCLESFPIPSGNLPRRWLTDVSVCTLSDLAVNLHDARSPPASRNRTTPLQHVHDGAERPVTQRICAKNTLRSCVRPEQKVNELHEAGLPRSVTRLPIARSLALISENDVEARAELNRFERSEVAFHRSYHRSS